MHDTDEHFTLDYIGKELANLLGPKSASPRASANISVSLKLLSSCWA